MNQETPDSAVTVKRLQTSQPDFEEELHRRLKRELLVSSEVTAVVSEIISSVRMTGDSAVLEYARKFDNMAVDNISELVVGKELLMASYDRLPSDQKAALEDAAGRIRRYHEKQRQESWQYTDPDGSVYGQKVTSLDRVGIYVPGGKANYPSSVLMLAIPASVAGVGEVIACVPTAYEEKNDLIFAAAALAGVNRVFTVGGAQAVAAMAYGTGTIPAVDKIAGPGNIYVTVAKKLVFGETGIDMIAGPSELTIICDGKTDPDWIAMDLFSQAEHDEQAQSILISPDPAFLDAVQSSIDRLLPGMERREIITASLKDRGLFVTAESMSDAAHASNLIAPEHLEISAEDYQPVLDEIRHAGAIFLGRYTAEALGDYCAGPSHVLPTSGSARFFSALGVYDFQKRSSIINCSPAAASELGKTASVLARAEYLEAHALSAEFRIAGKDG